MGGLRITSIAVRILGPATVTASFVPPPVLELAAVIATISFVPAKFVLAAKLVLPPIFRIPAALIVDRLVVLLLPSVRLLAWADLLLQQPTNIP